MPQAACDRVWNTASVAPRERFSYWQNAINGVLSPRSLKIASDQDFRGTLRAYSLGALSMTHGICSPIIVERTPADVALHTANYYYLVCPQQNEIFVRQRKRSATVVKGECALLYTQEPFYLESRHTSNVLAAQIPQDMIFNRISNVSDMTAINLSRETATGHALSAYLQSLPANRLRESALNLEALSGILLDLVEISLREIRNANKAVEVTERRVRGRTVRNFIMSHLNDPLLSPKRAALALGVSERSVHLAMKDIGQSFMTYVRESRLETIARKLEEPGNEEVRISDIAFDLGFNDLSSLHRSFRARYGMTPFQYRRQHQVKVLEQFRVPGHPV
ncbi:helix-turn-helix domain-containing protein [Paracoccus sp. (in: a-proteobacteria)]|uniref:helix-turn-helix domain-containing protein n=1 Tax=Paracoccus sp. TaxID=267 RepID=UPI002AFFE562|nr:helix-turn-helix domain-containing protein [Paracoccus sp. (in: a-proteobacteria)]